MLTVYTRHHPDCPKKDDSTYRRCRCPKWLDGTLPGRKGRFRASAKTKSWEQAELLARKYEHSAIQGEEINPAKMPTVKEAVKVFLGELLQTQRQFGSIDAGDILLRLKETALLKRVRLAVLTNSYIEDHSMSMELRRCIAVNRAGRIVLEGCGKELSRVLRGMNIADACLRIPLQFSECNTHAFTMRLAHMNITAHKRSQRNRLRCGEGRIPTGPVLNTRYLVAIFVLIGPCRLMPDKLNSALWVLPFTEQSKTICLDSAMQSPLFSERAAPFAVCLPVAAPVVLLL
jgi:hypothetical protein